MFCNDKLQSSAPRFDDSAKPRVSTRNRQRLGLPASLQKISVLFALQNAEHRDILIPSQ
jgi:hypothetical protein